VTLKERITEDMKAAMRASDKERLSTIRMVQAAIKQREVDERIVLDDAQVIAVLEKMSSSAANRSWPSSRAPSRPRRQGIRPRSRCSRSTCRPSFSEAEVDALIREAIASTGATSVKDMGKVMAP